MEVNKKIRYYKYIRNPNLEDQNYVCILMSSKTKLILPRLKQNFMNFIVKLEDGRVTYS